MDLQRYVQTLHSPTLVWGLMTGQRTDILCLAQRCMPRNYVKAGGDQSKQHSTVTGSGPCQVRVPPAPQGGVLPLDQANSASASIVRVPLAEVARLILFKVHRACETQLVLDHMARTPEAGLQFVSFLQASKVPECLFDELVTKIENGAVGADGLFQVTHWCSMVLHDEST